MCTDSTVTAARLLAELGMDSTTKAAYLEELRFAKRQQWAVTLAIIAFIAGAFHMAHSAKPLLGSGEKHVRLRALSCSWWLAARGCFTSFKAICVIHDCSSTQTTPAHGAMRILPSQWSLS
jgi:hypothetical protein